MDCRVDHAHVKIEPYSPVVPAIVDHADPGPVLVYLASPGLAVLVNARVVGSFLEMVGVVLVVVRDTLCYVLGGQVYAELAACRLAKVDLAGAIHRDANAFGVFVIGLQAYPAGERQ